jgi:hypothetical protein
VHWLLLLASSMSAVCGVHASTSTSTGGLWLSDANMVRGWVAGWLPEPAGRVRRCGRGCGGQPARRQATNKHIRHQISVCLRFLAGAHVFEAAEIQIREQILDPCLLLDSGLRDYEIKLDRRISGARESLQLFLFRN